MAKRGEKEKKNRIENINGCNICIVYFEKTWQKIGRDTENMSKSWPEARYMI